MNHAREKEDMTLLPFDLGSNPACMAVDAPDLAVYGGGSCNPEPMYMAKLTSRRFRSRVS
ncbi:MAG TPA: hypothetical protein VKM55_19620 [Candidatus Lokiarchaeia archaeon]|nr:hypothetical protein [Candidatus Lokiarchaeia archaeon]